MKQKRVVWVRLVMQIVFFLFIFTVVLSHFLEKRGGTSPGLFSIIFMLFAPLERLELPEGS